MSRCAGIRRSVRRMLLAAASLFLVSSLFPGGSAAAHVFTKLDGNDSPSKIDLRSASVSHTPSSVVHRVQTYNPWTPRSLQHDSFFVIGINKDSDRAYERCAFIYYTTRLRGQLSNCGAQFISPLPVVKSSGTTARITIPKSQTGAVYRWWAGTVWVGAPPCRNVCRDFAPNRLPDILHDLKPPTVAMSQALLNTWEVSDSMTFPFTFTVSDQDSGIKAWTVQRRPWLTTGAWGNVVTGSGAGVRTPDVPSTGGWFEYRVVATDRHGNRTVGPTRWVFEASDVDELTGPGTFAPAATPVGDPGAFGGDYVPLDDPGDSYEVTFTDPDDGNARDVKFFGPGDGTWVVEIFMDNVSLGLLSAGDVGDGQREVLREDTMSQTVTYRFVLQSGSGFGIDAVLI
jgi:hypothetical protein